MKLLFTLIITTTFFISCSSEESKNESQNLETINYDLIDIATLELNKPDTFYVNYLNHFIEKDNAEKVEEIWRFLRSNDRRIAEVNVYYANYINRSRTKNDEAIAIYKEAIAIKPTYYVPYKIIGNIYIHYNMLQDALNYLTQANQIEPKDIEVINNIANIYFVDSQYKIAVTYYTKGIELAPNELLYANRSICYEKLGMPELAEQDFNMSQSYLNKGK